MTVHYACLIVGPDPDLQLEPLSEHLEVPRYKLFLDAADIKLMAEEVLAGGIGRGGIGGEDA